MPALTRRLYPERPDCWHVYYDDVHAGTIARRVGNPHDTDQWEWICGFYPGCGPGEYEDATAATFEQARAGFEEAWQRLLPKRTEADFEAWRNHQTFTSWKYRMHDTGTKLPTELASGRSHCFCGAEITIASVNQHILAAHVKDPKYA
ncbi:MAG: hypothetical protein Q7T86_19390 [Hyphomicrobiaceae bacterium]|nr:hypothetical protein [Hyphomicrobiaceae bacterium]